MIPEGWTIERLGDIAEIVMGQSPPGETCNEKGIGIPLLNGPTEFGTHYPIPVQFTTDSRKKALHKDILFCVRGSTTGRMNWSDKEYSIGRGLAAIRSRLGEEYQYFIKGIIDHNLKQILSITTGSTFPNIGRDQLNNIEVLIPIDLRIQRHIALILSSLDDKIELNLQMNKTLESIAQAIFKEWFVDFRFPGFDGELVDGLPKEWRIGQIGDIADVIDCLHSKKPERVQTNTGCILLQLNNILDNGLLDPTDKFFISEQDYSTWISRIEITEGDCVITNVGRVGSVARIPKDIKAALGRNMTGIILNKNYPFPTFLIQLLVSDYMKIEIEKKKDFGTILDALNVKNIPKLSFPLPKIELISHFERIVSPMRSRMENNIKENITLFSIRDALLPKLMTGKIRVA